MQAGLSLPPFCPHCAAQVLDACHLAVAGATRHWEQLPLRTLVAQHPAHQWRAATAGPYVSRLRHSLMAEGVRCQAWALSAGGLVLDLVLVPPAATVSGEAHAAGGNTASGEEPLLQPGGSMPGKVDAQGGQHWSCKYMN